MSKHYNTQGKHHGQVSILASQILYGERNLEIYREHLQGKSYSQLADDYKLTPKRIGQIIHKFKNRKGVKKNNEP